MAVSGARPVVFVTGDPHWLTVANAVLDDAGCDVRRFLVLTRANRPAYLNALADNWAALVLVDGDQAGWQRWVSTIKTAQATRRIPVVVVTANVEVGALARLAGVEDVLEPGALITRLAGSVQELARRIDEADAEAMDCQCQEMLPPLAQEAVRMFNAGEYFRQHDLFEEQWKAEARPIRELYRAVLQVGVAYYHIVRGNYLGGLKMLQRSVQWFALLPDVCQGIDVRQLREDSARVRAVLETMHPAEIDSFDRSLLKPVIWIDSQ